MRRLLSVPAVLLAIVPAVLGGQKAAPKCDADNAGLKLPSGFCAIVYADSLRGASSSESGSNVSVLGS